MTQLVCCARDPHTEDAQYGYDDDADKMMWCRCLGFAVICLPLFVVAEIVGTAAAFCRPKSYENCCGAGGTGTTHVTTEIDKKAGKDEAESCVRREMSLGQVRAPRPRRAVASPR